MRRAVRRRRALPGQLLPARPGHPERSVFAHNVHATDIELELLAATGAWVAHCPTSNAALGSGLFPLRRHVEHGARVALGSDVGGGTGFSLLKEGLQAYFMQQLLGAGRAAADAGAPALPVHPGRRPGARAWPTRSGTSASARSSTRVWLRPADEQHPRRRPAARRRRTRRPGQDLRPGHPGRRRPRSGSAASVISPRERSARRRRSAQAVAADVAAGADQQRGAAAAAPGRPAGSVRGPSVPSSMPPAIPDSPSGQPAAVDVHLAVRRRSVAIRTRIARSGRPSTGAGSQVWSLSRRGAQLVTRSATAVRPVAPTPPAAEAA